MIEFDSRVKQELFNHDRDSDTAAVAVNIAPTAWNCSVCTFSNVFNQQSCEMCDTQVFFFLNFPSAYFTIYPLIFFLFSLTAGNTYQ